MEVRGTGDGGQGASVAGNIGKNDKLASQGHVDAGVSGAPKLMQENKVNMFLVMGIMSQPNRSGEQGRME
ncbi:hypothetical protein ACT7DA_15420 [Bacillus pacificus]